MRSLADGFRQRLELALRLLALAAIAVLIWQVRRPEAEGGTVIADREALTTTLARWTIDGPAAAHVVIDTIPDREQREWMRALRGAGTSLTWSLRDSALAPLVAVTEPLARPDGGARLLVSAGGERDVALSDGGGLIDSIAVGTGGAAIELPTPGSALALDAAASWATTSLRDSLIVRPVLVLGAAEWESKFTIAALEESGWQVAARLAVAPGVEVTQSAPSPIDTSRFSLAIVLDSVGPAVAAQLARYVRSGGGLVIGARAARLPALAAMGAGPAGERVAGIAGGVRSASPLDGLAIVPVARLREGALAVERRGRLVTAAARRVGAGRVVQLAYEDTWRWRMLGGDDAPAAHRAWWSRVASSVAFAPLAAPRLISEVDEAPYPSLVSTVGGPSPVPSKPGGAPAVAHWWWLLYALIAVALLAEWASRRLRGAA